MDDTRGILNDPGGPAAGWKVPGRKSAGWAAGRLGAGGGGGGGSAGLCLFNIIYLVTNLYENLVFFSAPAANHNADRICIFHSDQVGHPFIYLYLHFCSF